MSRAAISVEHVSKAYRLGSRKVAPDTLVGALASWITTPLRNFPSLRRLDVSSVTANGDDIVWAVKDVSFEVPEGQVLGIIGRNGAGKSTLLKMLSRITVPTSGRIAIHGRIA